ncbi:hypothetical protein [Pseudonocardia sp. DLS-67]
MPGAVVDVRGEHPLGQVVRDVEGDDLAGFRARQIAPLQTRYHPQVRETVATLAESDRRRTDTLAGFARWAGLASA